MSLLVHIDLITIKDIKDIIKSQDTIILSREENGKGDYFLKNTRLSKYQVLLTIKQTTRISVGQRD